jgi:hypothetical protein
MGPFFEINTALDCIPHLHVHQNRYIESALQKMEYPMVESSV